MPNARVLPGAGGSAPAEIAPGEGVGQAGGLNGERFGDPGRIERVNELRRHAERAKRGRHCGNSSRGGHASGPATDVLRPLVRTTCRGYRRFGPDPPGSRGGTNMCSPKLLPWVHQRSLPHHRPTSRPCPPRCSRRRWSVSPVGSPPPTQVLGLIAELDRRSAWGTWGCRSMAHWLSWHAGIDIGAAREQVRTARALEVLALTAERFGRGELSYSKVRALTRIATPGTEADLIEIAATATASQLERFVQAYRRSLVAEEATAERAIERRRVSWSWDDDGSLRVSPGCPPRMVHSSSPGSLRPPSPVVRHDRNRSRSTARRRVGGDGRGVPGRPAGHSHGWRSHPDRPPHRTRRPHRSSLRSCRLVACRLVREVVVCTRQWGGRRQNGARRKPHLEDGPGLAWSTVRRLCCDAAWCPSSSGPTGRCSSIGRRNRTIPRTLRRALTRRDDGCRFPGCNHTRCRRPPCRAGLTAGRRN